MLNAGHGQGQGVPFIARALRYLAFVAWLVSGCRSAGPSLDPRLEEQRRIVQALNRAHADLEAGVAELERKSASLDARAVSELLPEIARRDTAYRRLVRARRMLEDTPDSASIGRLDMTLGDPLPQVEQFGDGRNWMLQGYLIHRFGNTPHVIIVPPGFVTDLASVPDIAESLLPRAGEYSNAAIIHDYLYWTQSCTREQADNLMSIIMKETGVVLWKDLLIHGAVRLGGTDAWNANRHRRESGFSRTVSPPWDHSPSTVDWKTLQATLKQNGSAPGHEPGITPQVCALGNSTAINRRNPGN